MQTHTTHSNAKWFSKFLVLLVGAILLSGCGRDKDPEKAENNDKKPAYERVVILKQRFLQLENSLDEMERDLKIQEKRIDSTRDMAKAIKRSLLKGNLKGYSIDTISTDPMVLAAMASQQQKNKDEQKKHDEKEASDDTVINILLIAVFVIFLVMIFFVALKERNKATPFDTFTQPAYPPAAEEADEESVSTGSSPGADESNTSMNYGEIRPKQAGSTGDNGGLPPEDKPAEDEKPQ